MSGKVERPSGRAVWGLALASASFTVLTHGYRLVDQYYIQKISTEAQAALSTGVFFLVVLHASYDILAAGSAPWVARTTGARQHERRRRILGAALFGGLMLSIGIALLGMSTAELIGRGLGLSGETSIQFARYLRALSVTAAPIVVTPILDGAFVAMGMAGVPLLLHGLSLLFNILVTPLAIDAFGIEGAAWASTGSRALASGIGLMVLTRRTGLRLRHFRPLPELRDVWVVGAPVALATVFYGGVYWGLLRWAVSPLGPAVNAALGIGFSALEGVTWPLFHGLGIATGSWVGRSLGAGQPDLAWARIWSAIPGSALLGAMAGFAFWWFGADLTGLFTEDPVVHDQATTYAKVLAWSQVFVAFESLAEGILFGAGSTRSVFLISTPFNLLRVPAGSWAAVHFGAAGIWWVINLTTVVKAALLWAWIASGGWATALNRVEKR
ncbi:MAG: MATE family efflux transporter [Myxococcota bacterium]